MLYIVIGVYVNAAVDYNITVSVIDLDDFTLLLFVFMLTLLLEY